MHIDVAVGLYHLFCNHDDCLDREASVAMIEEVFQTGAEQINHKDIVQTFLSKVVDIGNASYEKMSVFASIEPNCGWMRLTAADQYLVCSVLVAKLRGIAFSGFL